MLPYDWLATGLKKDPPRYHYDMMNKSQFISYLALPLRNIPMRDFRVEGPHVVRKF